MQSSFVQLSAVTIHNFKNVEYGRIDLRNNNKKSSDTILALYGQNGSGKTALIQALDFFHFAASGIPIHSEFCDFINVNSEYSHFEFEFQIINNNIGIYNVFYECSIRIKKNNFTEERDNQNYSDSKKVEIFDEVLSYSYKDSNTKIRKTKVIDVSTPSEDMRTPVAFIPLTKYKLLIGNNIKTRDDVRVAKKVMSESARSFIFSIDLLKAINENNNVENSREARRVAFILQRMSHYALQELFVVSARDSALISLNTFPFLFKYRKENFNLAGKIPININKTSEIDESFLDIIKATFDNMNIVLEAIIPSLSVEVLPLGTKLSETGQKKISIEIVSNKNKKKIPLRYESEGIKKIVSILNLMISLYNQSSVTVAIDELDSGIFEYLLGEILKIISNKAKGQLIFTSHNLRPLETINHNFIAFTTTNPKNRYIRPTNIRDTNNLRDFYFRNITLGNNDIKLYQATNNAAISLAFREAGLEK